MLVATFGFCIVLLAVVLVVLMVVLVVVFVVFAVAVLMVTAVMAVVVWSVCVHATKRVRARNSKLPERQPFPKIKIL